MTDDVQKRVNSSAPISRPSSEERKRTNAPRKDSSSSPKAGGDEMTLRTAHEYIKKHIIAARPPQKDINISLHYWMAISTLKGYATLDADHVAQINTRLREIEEYAKDPSRKRPLNLLMQASPGSGKTTFIKCLAARLADQRVSHVNFNMSSMRGVDDMLPALDAVRNLKSEDKLPLLFLDEFDTSESNFALLLPLLLDGEFVAGHRQLQVGKAVIVLAGSAPKLAKAVRDAKAVTKATPKTQNKLPDLLSRINGGEVDIPGLDEVDLKRARDRRVDKACVTIALLKRRFGSQLHTFPWAFVRFVVDTKFRYGVRSIEQLIGLIPPIDKDATTLSMAQILLPLNAAQDLEGSPLVSHLRSKNGAKAIVQRWRALVKVGTRINCVDLPDLDAKKLSKEAWSQIVSALFGAVLVAWK